MVLRLPDVSPTLCFPKNVYRRGFPPHDKDPIYLRFSICSVSARSELLFRFTTEPAIANAAHTHTHFRGKVPYADSTPAWSTLQDDDSAARRFRLQWPNSIVHQFSNRPIISAVIPRVTSYRFKFLQAVVEIVHQTYIGEKSCRGIVLPVGETSFGETSCQGNIQ